MAPAAAQTLAPPSHQTSDAIDMRDGAALDQFSHGEIADVLRGTSRVVVANESQPEDRPALPGLAARLKDARREVLAGLIYRHRASGTAWGAPDRVLLARGDIQLMPSGQACMGGPFLDVMRGIERMIEALSSHDGALERDPPPLGPNDLPQGVRDRASPTAGCHAAFAAQGVIDDAIVRARIRYRSTGPEPWAAATCHERLAIGSEPHVASARERWLDEVVALMAYLDLDVRLISGDGGDLWSLHRAFERAFGLTIRVVTMVEGQSVPVMVVRDHLDRFGRAFGYQDRSGEPAYAATWSVDIEPFAYALMARFGPAPRIWPYAIRSVLGL